MGEAEERGRVGEGKGEGEEDRERVGKGGERGRRGYIQPMIRNHPE